MVKNLSQKNCLNIPYESLNFFFLMKQSFGFFSKTWWESLNLFNFDILCIELYFCNVYVFKNKIKLSI